MLSDTFNIYLHILRDVDKQVQSSLGCDEPNWRVQNACMACCYKLVDKPELEFNQMAIMDSNNSLKHIASVHLRNTADRHVSKSDYFIDCAFVDKFANEIRAYKQGATNKTMAPLELKTVDTEDGDSNEGPLLVEIEAETVE
ncbi:hypothetical protein FISHEDRAFT_75840 [Fistulina hepatica ATCC 64428]|uniref:Uncharacterized protein n=1 Tax=Fistulina hepatica ATCC 64428 TaxID=1128425 RepID=A0A0D7A659_9AGAR|nr:hypothetical protein FISHEDRAFT_75840 [Fistulina hepatica ATCC 64428]